MKVAACLILVAACSSGGPDCKSAVEGAAQRFGRAGVAEITTLIGECMQRAWPRSLRACFSSAKDGEALENCLPALDVKLPAPVVRPSRATTDVADKAKDVKALLFYAPDADVVPVLDEYFKALGVTVEQHDRIVEPANAERYRVTRDRVVLVRGDRSENIDVDAQLAMAGRVQLPRFDREVASAITRITTPQRHVYLTVGHGEINDPASVPKALAGQIAERRTTVLRSRLQAMSRLADLPPATFATDIPADATLVMVLAPAVALSAAEDASLGRYLDRGGALLFALDPTAPPGLGPLEGRLGVTFDHHHLVDDKSFLPTKKEAADHRIVVTTQLAAHPSIRQPARATTGVILIDSGTLAAVAPSPAGRSSSVTFTVQSMPTSFIDTDGNFELDGSERRASSNAVAAVTDGHFRAAVLADVDLLADVLVASNGRAVASLASMGLVDGTLEWLAGEDPLVQAPSGSAGADEIDAIWTKDSLVAERELVDRRRLRQLARAISARDDAARENAASEARHLERDLTDLHEKIEAFQHVAPK